MSDLLRLLNNVRQDPEISRVFSSIDKKYPKYILGSKTPVANQLFAPLTNNEHEFSKIIFSTEAYNTLQLIQEYDHKCTIQRNNKKQAGRPIKFTCIGYRDFDGDIIITDIFVPAFEIIRKNKITSDEQLDFLSFTNLMNKMNKFAQPKLYNYLKQNELTAPAIGNALVALIGTTKHPTLDDTLNTHNCFSLSELCEAVVPQEVYSEDILTGVISITPKTIEAGRLTNKRTPAWTYREGSLECAIISYSISPTTGVVKPKSINNIVQAEAIKENGQSSDLLISSSQQDTSGLYRARNNIKNLKYDDDFLL